MGKKEDSNNNLDIGLSEILEGRISESSQDKVIAADDSISVEELSGLFADILDPEPQIKEIETVQENLVESDSSDDIYSKLAQETKWDELRLLTEQNMSSDPSAKLWWILTQLTVGEMPVTVLCAPLDEAILSFQKNETFSVLEKKHCDLINRIALLLSSRLQVADEQDMSITILERVYRTTGSSEVRSELLRLVTHGLENLPRRVTLHTPSEMKKRLHLLDLKRELDYKDESSFVLDDSARETALPTEIKSSTHGRGIIFGVLVCLFSLTGWYLFQNWQSNSKSELSSSDSMVSNSNSGPSPEVPGVGRIGDMNHLAALAYDVADKDNEKAVTKPSSEEQKHPKNLATNPPVVEPKQIKPNIIDTSGPVESDRIRDIIDGQDRRSKYDDYEDDRGIGVDRARTEERERSTPRLPTRPLDDDRPYLSRRDQPGRWEGGTRYEIMFNTSVMDRPSFHAKEVAELYVGDRVLVDARVGRWLKIRSQKGVPGYLLAQDAEKLSD